MNRLIASALLGLGLASGVVACGDDDGAPSATGGTASGGSSVAGKNAGGSAQSGSSAGGDGGAVTGGSGGATAGSAGTAGSAAGGSSSGGTPAGGAGGDDGGMGGEAVGGDAAGGAGGAPTDEPEQMATAYWLNKFCESQATETLDCENSIPWFACYDTFSPFLAEGDGGGFCTNEKEEDINMEQFPLTIGLFDQLAATAAACGITSSEDWSCDFNGEPTPSAQRCRDENEKLRAADIACGGSL